MIKKLFFTSLASLALCASANAQVFSEDFENGVPGTMSIEQLASPATPANWAGCSGFSADNCAINGNSSAEFLSVSNPAEEQNSVIKTPVMDLSGTTDYEINFYYSLLRLYGQSGGTFDTDFFVEISTDNGSTWSIVKSYTPDPNITTNLYESLQLSSFTLTNQTQIRFRANTADFGYASLDDVTVTESFADDAALLSVDNERFVTANNNIDITGEIRNDGTNNLTSFELNWQIDSGTIYTETINGLNVAPAQTYTYTHQDQWSATAGDHNLKVWITNVNGSSNFDNSNVEINKDVTGATQSNSRMPLYERFTSSTCAPCATFNEGAQGFNGFNALKNQRGNEFIYLAYHVQFPAQGDPYFIPTANTRRTYYNVTGVPTLLINANEATTYDDALLQQNLDNAIAQDGYFEINTTANIVNQIIEIDLDINPYLSGDFTVQVAVVEKETTGNVPSSNSNGETEFPNVMMAMLPNANGTNVNFTAGQNYQTTLTKDLSNTFVEEWDDLDVIVFIQHEDSKSILQSKKTETTLSNDKFSSASFSLFPNPAKNSVNIEVQNPSTVIVSDLSGRIVITEKELTVGNNLLDVKSLDTGIYLTQISSNGKTLTKKLIIE